MLRSLFRNVPGIAIAFLVLLCCVSPALACGQATGSAAGTVSLVPSLNPAVVLPQKESCTRENMDKCESSCTTRSGVLDLNCYEECIYYIC